MLDRFGSDLPVWDQWDAEGLQLLVPWFEDDRFLHHLLLPQNEHRIVATKLQNLALTLAAGQWDSRLECVANAALVGLFAGAVWLVGRRCCAPVWRPLLFVVVAMLFGLPFAWHNIIGGLHSAQHWLLWGTLLTLVFLPFARVWTWQWWFGAIAAVASLGTMGSGFLAAASALPVIALRCWHGRERLRTAWPTLVVISLIVLVAVVTRVEVPYHDSLKAKSFHDYLHSAVHSLQWPVMSNFAWLAALVLWTPWLLVFARSLRAVEPAPDRLAQTVAAFGGWVLLQILATAYARGAGGGLPAPRYMDTLAFGMATNVIALTWIFSQPARAKWAVAARGALALAWLGLLGSGLHAVTKSALEGALPDSRRYVQAAETRARVFLATGDRSALESTDIPYPGAESFIFRVSQPSLSRILPVSIRPPLPLRPDSNTTETFHLVGPGEKSSTPAPGFAHESLPAWISTNGPVDDALGVWRSLPLTAPLGGWLKFELRGNANPPEVALELRDAATDTVLSVVRPRDVKGTSQDEWVSAHVRAPTAPFVVVARNMSDRGEIFGFTAPVEMSSLSHWAWRLTQSGRLLATLGSMVALSLAIGHLFSKRRKRRHVRKSVGSSADTVVATGQDQA